MAGELAGKSGDVRDKILQANMMADRFRQLPPERQLEEASKKQLQEILDLYREAVDMAPENPDAWLAYVLNLQQHGRGDEARLAVHEAAEKLPDQPPQLKPLDARSIERGRRGQRAGGQALRDCRSPPHPIT